MDITIQVKSPESPPTRLTGSQNQTPGLYIDSVGDVWLVACDGTVVGYFTNNAFFVYQSTDIRACEPKLIHPSAEIILRNKPT